MKNKAGASYVTFLKKRANELPPSALFPRLVKPPVLTSSSQPVIQVDPRDLPTLPKMRVNGSKPKFVSELIKDNPYYEN